MTKHILIIDDDKELAAEIMQVLKDEGFYANIATDGLKGEELIKKNHYDIVLMDIKMPGMDGIKLLDRIKGSKSSAKIFLMSGRPLLDKLVEEKGLQQIVKGILPKPFNIEDLLEKIKSA